MSTRGRRLLAMVIGVGGAVGAAAAVAAGAAPAAAPAAGDPQLTEQLTSAYERLERAVRGMPRDGFEPCVLIESVGRDPDALCAWVRENTDQLPYRGMLRGPVGVLMDRGGSSLDRALLLADLLRQAGHAVRLARATLPPDTAADLLRRTGRRAPPAAAGQAVSPAL